MDIVYKIEQIGFFDDYGEEGAITLPGVSGASLKEAFEKAVLAINAESNRWQEEEEFKVGLPGTDLEWYSNAKLWAIEDQTADNGLYLLIAGIHTDEPGEEAWYCKITKTVDEKPVPLSLEDFAGINFQKGGEVLSTAHSNAEEFYADAEE